MLSNSRLFLAWLFGFISGFAIMISGNTLNYWLAKENIDLQTIGILSFILLPYSINFLWAPIFDTVKLGRLNKILGHRLSWIYLIGILLAFAIFILSFLNPTKNLLLFALVALIISFLSSAQDTILSAFRTEIIIKEAQGTASGIYIFGYRIGMLFSGSGAIYLSSYLTFNEIYKIFAVSIVIYLVPLIFFTKYFNVIANNISIPSTNYSTGVGNFILSILKPIGSLSFITLIIIFLILYRLPDNFINVMINPFLIHLGYNNLEIASAGKFLGVIGAIIGGLIASFIMQKKNILDSIFLFGVIHSLAHILFIALEIYGKNLSLLFITIAIESITGGMAMTAYIAFISSLCHGKFRATQYSFFSAMMGFSRAIFPTISGYIVVNFGWQNFFAFTTIITIPSLLAALKIKNRFLRK
ncbi:MULTISPECIES: AmpG family muropeptide MFS transporter [unclassified Rickettsia]|uniref:AmpG family muropeptide MFS transporter n=1 Tax=unclassified Rickettsia TaxID=114295 RepID=UPI003132C9CD